MASLPRATCPICGRDVAVRVNGALREHMLPGDLVNLCPGSGEQP